MEIKAFKIICICLTISSIVNMTLWIRLSQYREVIILFPLSDIIYYMKLQHMNFFIMVVLFGLTIFGVYITLESRVYDILNVSAIIALIEEMNNPELANALQNQLKHTMDHN